MFKTVVLCSLISCVYGFTLNLHQSWKSVVLRSSVTANVNIDFGLQTKPFLHALMSSRSKDDTKKMYLEKLRSLKSNDSRSGELGDSSDLYNSFVDKVIREVEDIQHNSWAMADWPFPLPSYRVKLGCLFKVFTSVLDEQRQSGISNNENESSMKRRAMLLLFNQLKSCKGVRVLERECRSRKNRNSMSEMLQRTPALETPQYDVIDQRNGWEVRQYKPFSVCSFTTNTATVDSNTVGSNAGAGAFNQLANYIFGGNQAQFKMSMTTPVIMTESAALGSESADAGREGPSIRKMSFVMPSAFWNSTTDTDSPPAPPPLPGSGVTVEGAGGGLIAASPLVAVRWFGGYASKPVVSRQIAQLLEDVENDTDWTKQADQQPYSMQYNDPFQPPWMRRNEVAIPVRRRKYGALRF